MGRMYSVTLPETNITAAADLFELTIATDKPCKIWGWMIGQDTDVGDAAEEVLQLTLKRGVTAGSGGSAITPAAMNSTDAAAAATCTNRTTAHTSGTILAVSQWNIRTKDEVWFLPEIAPQAHATTDPVVLNMSAPADSITVSGTLWFEEF